MEPSDVMKIAVVGAESTGKTKLAEALAQHYHTAWVPEYARQYLQDLNRPYTAHDVETIARGQMALEEELGRAGHSPLFCDTNLLVIKVWMDDAFGSTPAWMEEEIVRRPYHLHVLTDPNIPYEADPLREHPELRPHFTQIYMAHLERYQLPYLYVSGNLQQRMEAVTNYLETF